MKYLNFLVLTALLSCSAPEVRQTLEDSPYRTSGVEQFFLPELPAWANASGSGQCFKSSSYQYFDFSKLASAYGLNYVQLLELQAQYNERVENYFRSAAVRFLKPVEQSSFFSNALEQVRGGIKSFKLPKISEVDLIWVDDFIASGKVSELKKRFQEGGFDERLPVVFSSCLSKQYLQQWLAENELDDGSFYLLSAEWLNPYGPDFKLGPGLRIELGHLMPGVKVNVISTALDKTPTELIL